MRKGVILFFVLIIGIASVFFLLKTGSEPVKEKAITGLLSPDFELIDIDGKTWRLSDLKGKVVLVNFWATWCETCKEEKPFIRDILNSEIANSIVFLSVLYNDSPSNAIKYMQDAGYKFPVLIDDKSIASQYGVSGVPETFLINKKGVLAKKFIGGIHWNMIDFNESLNKLINEI